MVENVFATLFVLCFFSQPLAVLAGLVIVAWPTKTSARSMPTARPIAHGHA
jgi:hypothetical protein